MEIILKKDVKNLGYADDVVNVKNGYGLNFLIPKGFAVIASETNKKVHAEIIKQRAHKVAKIRSDAQTLAQSLAGVTLHVNTKVGDNNKIYGSVTAQNLADLIKKMGYAIDKKQISMPEDKIKQTGNYTAEIVIHRDIKTKINFEVRDFSEQSQ